MRIKEVCEDVKGEPKQRLVFTSSFFFFPRRAKCVGEKNGNRAGKANSSVPG